MRAAGRAVFVGAVAIGAAVAFACGGDGSPNSVSSPATSTVAGGPTEPPSTGVVVVPTERTPGSFEDARQKLIARLQDYSATIGAVPNDLLAQLLGECEALAQQSDDRAAGEEICADIERAARAGDPGLVDRAIDRLVELQPG